MDVTDDELTTVSQLNALFCVSALLIPGFQYLPETKQKKKKRTAATLSQRWQRTEERKLRVILDLVPSWLVR